jgi:Cu(I)/Ag(I) efflux system membrane fusion protein
VALDDNRVFKLLGATDGWVRQLQPVTAGSPVRKGDLLATFTGREFVAAEQAYFYALSTLDRYKQGGKESPDQLALTSVQVQSAFDNLRALGMGEAQLEHLTETRKATADIEIRAPVTGVVLARNLFPATRFERGAELYRIADLSRIWILAQTFEGDTAHFRPGRTVRVRSGSRAFTATVSNALAAVSPENRTRLVRLEAANPNLALAPDMFVDVELSVSLPPAVNVPAEAILDAGLHKTVYVDRGNGAFEPRAIETGWKFDGRVEVVRGLDPGERIVVSGNFLIDSESRLESTGQPGAPPEASSAVKDPSCGMDVNPRTAAEQSTAGGKRYYFCSRGCREKFEQLRGARGPAPAHGAGD